MVVRIAWNAGAVRARLLGRRRLGREGRRDLARLGSLEDALRSLRGGPYGDDVGDARDLASAQWRVAATPLWHLRILAGWLPPAGGDLVRVLAGWWEVLNVENHLAGLAGATSFPPYELGRLETAWDRLRRADSVEQVRSELAASPWLDPGADDLATVVTWLRLSWAHRVANELDQAARLAAGWAALIAAGDLLLGSSTRAGNSAHRVRELGWDWVAAGDVQGLRDRLPAEARWVLHDVEDPEELWRAEVTWWRTAEAEGHRRSRSVDSGPDAVLGAFALLLTDAHGVQSALELAAWGSDEEVAHELL